MKDTINIYGKKYGSKDGGDVVMGVCMAARKDN